MMAMDLYGGFIYVNDEGQRAERIQGKIEGADEYGRPGALYTVAESTFTDFISASDWRPKERELFLLSFDRSTITAAALVKRVSRAATLKYKIQFTHIVSIPPLAFKSLEERIGPRLASYFVRSADGAGQRVPPGTWRALMAAIRSVDSEAAAAIDGLDRLRRLPTNGQRGNGYAVMAEEKDAVALALEFTFTGGMRERELRQWAPGPQAGPAPFLEGLRNYRVLEDAMISHDAGVFADWLPSARHPVGVVEFSNHRDRLTIYNANRTRLEESLGVDLLYYNHRFHSFVMVQYKRMVTERGHNQNGDTTTEDPGADDRRSEVGYRPVDKSYQAELARMRAFLQANPDAHDDRTIDAYRLHAGPFYFKLCPATIFEPLSTGLMKGMYLPLDYWEALMETPSVKGVRGGLRVTYDNVGRYLTNSLFTDLVQHGYVGSRLATTDALSAVVRQSLEANRSVIAALARPATDASLPSGASPDPILDGLELDW